MSLTKHWCALLLVHGEALLCSCQLRATVDFPHHCIHGLRVGQQEPQKPEGSRPCITLKTTYNYVACCYIPKHCDICDVIYVIVQITF